MERPKLPFEELIALKCILKKHITNINFTPDYIPDIK